jgi:hypothetical protein
MRSRSDASTPSPGFSGSRAGCGRALTSGSGPSGLRVELGPSPSKCAGESKTVPSTSNSLIPRSRATKDVWTTAPRESELLASGVTNGSTEVLGKPFRGLAAVLVVRVKSL